MRAVLLVFLCFFGASATLAEDRFLTNEEFTRLVEAMTEAGCSGGKVTFDETKFEVGGSVCADGKKYDLAFDSSFKLIEKKAEN